MKNGYSICFNEWALDKSINGELGLLLIISSLCAENGFCFASNDYFAELFNEHETTISRKLKKLSKKGYITIEYEKRGAEVKNRILRLANLLTDDYQFCYPTISRIAKDNIISNTNNIKEIDNNKLLSTKKKFIPPTLEEVQEYCKERKNNINPQKFFDYYNVDNWKDVKNWKKKMITWELKSEKQPRKETIEELNARILRELEEEKNNERK